MENTRKDGEMVRISLMLPTDNSVHVRELGLDEHLQYDVMMVRVKTMVVMMIDMFSLKSPV